MTCREQYFDSLAGLLIQTWCGDVDQEDKPVQVCRVDDQNKPRHYVEITNSKTLDRKVTVRGIVEKKKARFEGDPSTVISEEQWKHSVTVSGKRGLDRERLAEAIVCKKLKGDERIKVEVEYEDQWNSAIKKRADDDQLVFGITIL